MAHKVCPYLVGFLLIMPFRRFIHDPEKILRPYISPGMTVLDVGSAMGYFSLPLAAMVGPAGKVICVDVQEKMLSTLRKRAAKATVGDRVIPRQCTADSLVVQDLAEKVDFALAFAVVHEVPNAPALFRDLFAALKPEGHCLVAEPKGHVSKDEWARTLAVAEQSGFDVVGRPMIARCHAVVLARRS